MKYFAEIDENNLVVNIYSVDDYTKDENGTLIPVVYESTPSKETHTIIQYSVNDISITNNEANVGYTYNVYLNAFIPPQPDPRFILNKQTFEWEPDENLKYDLHGDGKLYRYNKELNGWIPTWDPEE